MGAPSRLSLGIRRPDRRIPPLPCPDLPGFRQGSVLADSEQRQTRAGRDPHILFRDGAPEMRSRHSVVCIFRLPNNSLEPRYLYAFAAERHFVRQPLYLSGRERPVVSPCSSRAGGCIMHAEQKLKVVRQPGWAAMHFSERAWHSPSWAGVTPRQR